MSIEISLTRKLSPQWIYHFPGEGHGDHHCESESKIKESLIMILDSGTKHEDPDNPPSAFSNAFYQCLEML